MKDCCAYSWAKGYLEASAQRPLEMAGFTFNELIDLKTALEIMNISLQEAIKIINPES